jgi:hypothetical protein
MVKTKQKFSDDSDIASTLLDIASTPPSTPPYEKSASNPYAKAFGDLKREISFETTTVHKNQELAEFEQVRLHVYDVCVCALVRVYSGV